MVTQPGLNVFYDTPRNVWAAGVFFVPVLVIKTFNIRSNECISQTFVSFIFLKTAY